MLRYAAKRLLTLVVVLAAAVGVTFAVLQLVPGDPILVLLGDQSGDPALERRLREEYGLDRPRGEQFLGYVGGIARGDFSSSRTTSPSCAISATGSR